MLFSLRQSGSGRSLGRRRMGELRRREALVDAEVVWKEDTVCDSDLFVFYSSRRLQQARRAAIQGQSVFAWSSVGRSARDARCLCPATPARISCPTTRACAACVVGRVVRLGGEVIIIPEPASRADGRGTSRARNRGSTRPSSDWCRGMVGRLRGCINRGVCIIGGKLTRAAGRVRVGVVAGADGAPRTSAALCRR